MALLHRMTPFSPSRAIIVNSAGIIDVDQTGACAMRVRSALRAQRVAFAALLGEFRVNTENRNVISSGHSKKDVRHATVSQLRPRAGF
jgi:hypothetical protein